MAATDDAGDDDEDGSGVVLGLAVLALLLGGVGVALGGLAFRRTR